jgi:hypothetical protein
MQSSRESCKKLTAFLVAGTLKFQNFDVGRDAQAVKKTTLSF